MKVLLEILIVLILLYIGWNKPFNGYASRITGVPVATPAPAPAVRSQAPARAVLPPTSTPLPKSSWIYQPSRLDRKEKEK